MFKHHSKDQLALVMTITQNNTGQVTCRQIHNMEIKQQALL